MRLLPAAALFLLIAPADAAPRAKKAAADPAIRTRIAAFLLRRADFGSYSILPVRFTDSRIAGPFEEEGRSVYCVSTKMHGRSVGKPERPRAIVRANTDAGGSTALRAEEYDSDVCGGHRSEPYPEFEEAAKGR